MCALKCKTASPETFAFFGLEYGVECYCGPAIVDSSVLTTDGRCNMPCGGNAAETCGGSYGMNIYSYNPVSSSSTVRTSSSSTKTPTISPSATSTKSTAVSMNAPTSTPIPFTSMGCWTDNDVTERTLIGGAYTDQNLTLQICASLCSKGFTYFGVEYSTECYCGNNIGSTSILAIDGRCNMPCKGDPTQNCGGSYGMNIYKVPAFSSSSSLAVSTSASLSSSSASSASTSSTRSATPTPSIPAIINEFTYQHCHSDNTTKRTLVGKYIAKPDMTLENCAGNCTGYRYFGVEYASECYCANQLSFGSFIATDGRCKMPCLGNKLEICGGSGGLTLYSNATIPGSSSSSSSYVLPSSSSVSSTATASSQTSISLSTLTSQSLSSSITSTSARPTATGPTPAYISNFNYLHCATDTNEDRTLVGKYLASGSMNLDLCASTCADYRFFGVEYGIECFCGDTLSAISIKATDDRCNYPCPGNAAEICGGMSGLTLYTKDSIPIVSGTSSVVSTSLSLGSLSRSSSSTALSSVSPSSTFPTSSSSLQLSGSSTSTVSPLMTSSSSSSFSSVSSTVSSKSSTQLSSTSTSSSSSSQLTSSLTQIPSSSSSTRSSSTLVVPTTSSSTPSTSSFPDTWDYLGCVNDTTTARAISGATLTNTTAMTVDMCKDFCESKNFPLAGLENLGICFCGLAVKNGGILGQTGCTATCPGDKTQICGGSKRLNVYTNTAYIPPSVPKTSGAYNYTACYNELTNSRAMTGYSFTNTTAMTVDVCTMTCSSKGYLLAGLQFGAQCYCSNTISSAAPIVDDSQCQALVCPGNKLQYCSAGNRLQVYSR
ncbi:WSC domain-containing protein [Cadophora sp. MPI-SDFR-AT-0126]|nr:WSC domain-containing protein [Leotiomycetes sp. MPI-SDFR-AT-0126]